jgi:purine-binding chemotaxis protein CheW
MAERFLTFRVDGELYALPANQVAEVIRLPAVARVPQAPKGLLGLANLRGSVLPVASVRGMVGADESAEATTRAIVLDGAAPVALAVDVVEALVAVETERIETRQAELATRPGERLKGAFVADGRNAIAKILDIEGLIGAAFVQEARARPRRAMAGAAVPERETDGQAGDHDRQMLVSFDVAGQEYALALDVVQEILDTPEALAALPASEALVLAVTPFRDTLLPLLSLRACWPTACGASFRPMPT